jgi:serine/threonine protein kinase
MSLERPDGPERGDGPARPAARVRAAEMMERYVERRPLARTPNSVVCEVEGCSSGGLFALKKVRCLPAFTKARRLLLAYSVQEARILSHLAHPNIVRLHDFFADGQHHCLVLELCTGGDLGAAVERARRFRSHIEPAIVAQWAREILEAVAYTHSQNIIHRDIKPQNLLLSAAGNVRLADFGAARLLHDAGAPVQTARTGTLPYMAPEARVGQPYTSKADAWGAGAVLCELISLQPAASGAPLLSQLEHGRGGAAAAVACVALALLRDDPAFRPAASEALARLCAPAPGGRGAPGGSPPPAAPREWDGGREGAARRPRQAGPGDVAGPPALARAGGALPDPGGAQRAACCPPLWRRALRGRPGAREL